MSNIPKRDIGDYYSTMASNICSLIEDYQNGEVPEFPPRLPSKAGDFSRLVKEGMRRIDPREPMVHYRLAKDALPKEADESQLVEILDSVPKLFLGSLEGLDLDLMKVFFENLTKIGGNCRYHQWASGKPSQYSWEI